jgi:hypothetical protein
VQQPNDLAPNLGKPPARPCGIDGESAHGLHPSEARLTVENIALDDSMRSRFAPSAG